MIQRSPLIRRRANRGKKTSKRRKSRLALRRECDRRFAFHVKQRDAWICRACGNFTRIQCAHNRIPSLPCNALDDGQRRGAVLRVPCQIHE